MVSAGQRALAPQVREELARARSFDLLRGELGARPGSVRGSRGDRGGTSGGSTGATAPSTTSRARPAHRRWRRTGAWQRGQRAGSAMEAPAAWRLSLDQDLQPASRGPARRPGDSGSADLSAYLWRVVGVIVGGIPGCASLASAVDPGGPRRAWSRCSKMRRRQLSCGVAVMPRACRASVLQQAWRFRLPFVADADGVRRSPGGRHVAGADLAGDLDRAGLHTIWVPAEKRLGARAAAGRSSLAAAWHTAASTGACRSPPPREGLLIDDDGVPWIVREGALPRLEQVLVVALALWDRRRHRSRTDRGLHPACVCCWREVDRGRSRTRS